MARKAAPAPARSARRSAPRPKPAGGPQHPARAAPEPERPIWLFLCEPGLVDLLVLELKARKVIGRKSRPTKVFLRNYDAAVFPDSQVTPANLGGMRLLLHALAAPVFGRRNITEGQIARLAGAWRREKADALVSSVAGSHFNRQDLMRWLGKQLAGLGIAAPEGGEGAEKPCWLVVVDDSYWFGFSRFNHHDAAARDRSSDRTGALPATVAAAIAFSARLQPDEVVWDPVCGSGALLREAAALSQDATLIGSDVDADALRLARELIGPRRDLRLEIGDAAVFDPGLEVTLTLANLPWGRQYESEGGNPAFYRALLENSLAHAAPGWRAVVITSDATAIRAAARENDLAAELAASPKVRGVETGIWRLYRR